MKCKAVLLNPPTAAPSSEILLNLAYLSSVLKKAGHNVIVIDATAPHNKLNEEEINKKIKDYKPHFIGITLTIVYIPQTYDYLKRLKELNIPIIAGGPHANCLPEEVLAHDVDIVSIGEGEDTIVELAEYFLGKKKLNQINGICYKKKDGSYHYTQRRPLINDLDRIPFPDYDSFPIINYTGSKDPHSNPIFWSLFSSRGCPYNCIFCSSHNVFGRTYRIRTPKNVFEEINYLAERFGTRMFAFQDDEAFINKERIIEFCNLVNNGKYKLKFSARLRIDSLELEMLKAMKSAGFSRLAFGIESFNDETLEKINKKYNIKQIANGFEILQKAGFNAIYFNNLVGFPWEKEKHMELNLEEIKKIPKNIIFFSSTNTLIPYPGTELYEKYHKQYNFTNWWLDHNKNSPFDNTNLKDAFFMMFLRDQIPLWQKDNFWKLTTDMKKSIIRYCWKTASLSLKRCLTKPEYYFVFYTSKLSYFLWKISPTLEKRLLKSFVKFVKRLNINKKTNFTYY